MGNTINKQANVTFNIEGADQSRQEIDKIRIAIEGLEGEGKKLAQPLVDAFENIQLADENVTKKISEGRLVTERDGKVIIQQFEGLKDIINAAFGSISKAPAQVQEAYAKAEAQFEATTKKIRSATDAVDDQGDVLKEGQVQWSGMSDAVNKSIGRFGAVQIGIAAAFAALKEGLSIGTQVAQAIGTDFQAAESAASGLKSALAGITNALVTDGLVAAWQQTKAVMKTADDTVNGSGDAIKGYTALVNAGVDRVKALAVSTDDLRMVAAAYALAQQGGADGLKLFNDTVRQTDPKDLGDKLDSLKAKFGELAEKAKEAAQRHDELKKAQDSVRSSIESLIQKIQDEITWRQRGGAAIDAAIGKYDVLKRAIEDSEKILGAQEKDLGGVTLSMGVLVHQIGAMLPSYDQLHSRIDIANTALKTLIEQNETLTPEEKKRLDSIQDQIAKYKELDPATQFMLQQRVQEIATSTQAKVAAEAHAQGLDGLTGKTKAAGEAQDTINTKWSDGEQKLKLNSTAVDEHGKAIEKAKVEITNAGQEIDRAAPKFSAPSDKMKDAIPDMTAYDSAVLAIDTKMRSLAQSIQMVNDALDRNASAFAKAAGAAGSSSGSSSSSGSASSPGAAGYFDSVPAEPGPEPQPGNMSGL
jgi:chromosome segregation ATPase